MHVVMWLSRQLIGRNGKTAKVRPKAERIAEISQNNPAYQPYQKTFSNTPIPCATIAAQTFGDFLGFNPHCHVLVTNGCSYGDGEMFRVDPPWSGGQPLVR